ncbi:MAG: Hsp20/alpha crystallin family protein [Kiritimatiellae bacterium]|nr:Hsp20/alpha crystallin family protein [Kiritimatiellia bacterium]MDD5520095.1 Hsp20/alpha crystallin family protein [Kiritimatiellia bacterium]
MDQTDNNVRFASAKWITVERIMLVIILFLQTAILLWLWREHNLRIVAGRAIGNLGHGYSPAGLQQRDNRDLPQYPVVPSNRRKEMVSSFTPLQDARNMFDQMDSIFESFIGNPGHVSPFVNLDDGWDALLTSPTMDMKERDNRYVVVFSIPGVQLSDIAVTLDGRILTVITAVYGGGMNGTQVGTFERSVQLPGPVGDAHLAQAILTNGILRVSIPKSVGAEPAGKRRKLL